MYTFYSKLTRESPFSIITEPAPDSWIHAEKASFEDLKTIANILNIDVDDIKDTLDKLELARIERIDKDCVVIYARYPYMLQEESGVYTTLIALILSKEHFVTICPTNAHLIQKMIAEPSKIITKARAKLLILILLQIMQEYTRVIRRIRSEVINQEKDISKVTDGEIIELTRKEEYLNQCLNSIQPLKEVIEELLSGKFATIHEEDQEQLEDLLLASDQAEDLCRLSLRIISSLRNSVQVIITNQFNKTIRLLTAMTIILNFPTTIASIYGMNVHLPLENHPLAFPIIIGFILLASIGAFFFFQRRRWL